MLLLAGMPGRKVLNAEGKQLPICYLVSRAEKIPQINPASKLLPSSTGYCSAAAYSSESRWSSFPPSIPPSLSAVSVLAEKLFSNICTRARRYRHHLSRSSAGAPIALRRWARGREGHPHPATTCPEPWWSTALTTRAADGSYPCSWA